jgi:hypothetical protein
MGGHRISVDVRGTKEFPIELDLHLQRSSHDFRTISFHDSLYCQDGFCSVIFDRSVSVRWRIDNRGRNDRQ